MITPTTFIGAKDILSQYVGDEYYIIYEKLGDTLGYWLVEIMDTEGCVRHNELEACSPQCKCSYCSSGLINNIYHTFFRSPEAVVHIPEFIMLKLIKDGFVVRSMSDKEWRVQIALGTAPAYRPYLISGEVI